MVAPADWAESATADAVLPAACAVSETTRVAVPISVPTASADRVSASPPPAGFPSSAMMSLDLRTPLLRAAARRACHVTMT